MRTGHCFYAGLGVRCDETSDPVKNCPVTGRDNLKNLNVDGRIILKWILNKVGGCELN
jgi:hypothetical protein